MSSVIDPVTGLPIVVPLTTGLDTIPLGVQTFPWKDYKATQRPNRQLLYPDDIIPVSANVAGMYQDQSQAVGTDGNHALLTFVVNQSGGGGSNPTPILYDKFNFGVTFDITGGNRGNIPFFNVIVVMVLSVAYEESTRLGFGGMTVNVINEGVERDIQDLTIYSSSALSGGGGVSADNIVIPFNPPWLVRESTLFSDSLYTLDISGAVAQGVFNITTWGYNLP